LHRKKEERERLGKEERKSALCRIRDTQTESKGRKRRKKKRKRKREK